MEDTSNLLGHALKKVMRVVAKEAGAEVVSDTSLKAALDRDWDQVGEREEALGLVVKVLQAVQSWVQTLAPHQSELAQPSLDVAQQVKAQDVQVDENGKASLIRRAPNVP